MYLQNYIKYFLNKTRLFLFVLLACSAKVSAHDVPAWSAEQDSSKKKKFILFSPFKKHTKTHSDYVPEKKNKFSFFKKKPTSPKDSSEVLAEKRTLMQQKLGLKKPHKDTLQHDSLKKPKLLNAHGTLNWGYHYGWIPFLNSTQSPNQFYRADGNLQVDALNLPLLVSYNYSNAVYTSGLRNYFNVSFDAQRYKEKLVEKKQIKLQQYDKDLLNLESQKIALLEKQNYLKSLGSIENPVDFASYMDSVPDFNTQFKKPSLSDSLSVPDSLNIHYPDTAELMNRKKALLDKISSQNQELTKLQSKINEIKALKDQLSASPNIPQADQGLKEKVLGNLNKFEIGMINPNVSPFLLSGINLQGVHMEWEDKNYISVSHGITAAPLFNSTDPLQNKLNYAHNLFNFFDFANIESGRKITAIKGGIGKKQGSHLYAGISYGLGRTMLSYNDLNPIPGDFEKNYVIELDGRYQISATHFAEFFYGKTHLQQTSIEDISLAKGFMRILNNTRSNAALVRYTVAVPKIKSKFTASMRWIDPYFKSFGVGFLRSDNFRYELNSEHTLTKKINVSFKLRKEEDNLLGLYDYKNYLTTAGTQIKWKPIRRLNIVYGYIPVVHKLETPSQTLFNKNRINNLVISYAPSSKYFNQLITAAYNYYVISGDSSNNKFQTVNLNYEIAFEKGLKFLSSVNAYRYHLADSGYTETYLASVGSSVMVLKNWNVSAMYKYSYLKSVDLKSQGYSVKSTFKINKFTDLELLVEKIVKGEYYNTIQANNMSTFPYYCYIKIVNRF